MAHGRPDYWTKEAVGLPVPTVGESLARIGVSRTIAALDVDYMGAVTVPAGFVYFLQGGAISCSAPIIQLYGLKIGVDIAFKEYFDTRVVFPFTPACPIQIDAGQSFDIQVENLDSAEHSFWIVLFYLVVTLVPSAGGKTGDGLVVYNAGV
jgi:hypothetical protein